MDFDDYETLPTNDVVTHMTAGAFAGVMEHCVMYPVDSVKTRMQSLSPSPNATYRGIGEALTRMVQHEGLFTPVRGMGAVVIGAGPAHALYFATYEKLKDVFTTHSHLHHLAYGLAGCGATLLHDLVMTPADVVKQRMQMYNSPYKSCTDCISKVYRTEGSRAFFRSYTTQLTMNIPFQSIHFMIYEFMQTVTNKERTYNPAAHMASGAVSGALAAAVTTPLDVCKTLLNTQEAETLSHTRQARVTGMLHAMRTVYQVSGVRGYFQGMQARVLYQMPSTAICWTVYEFFKYFISKKSSSAASESIASDSLILFETPSTPPPQASLLESSSSGSSNLSSSGDRSHAESWEGWALPSGGPLKSRELPVAAAGGIYGSLSFTTAHESKVSVHKGTLLDVTTRMSHG